MNEANAGITNVKKDEIIINSDPNQIRLPKPINRNKVRVN